MKLRLKATEPVRDGLRRIAQGEAARARERLATPDTDRATTVHAIRVATKRLRAVWRLLRPVAGEDAFRQENARLREAADSLARLRDQYVVGQTLQDLLRHAGAAERRAIHAFQHLLATPRTPPASPPPVMSAGNGNGHDPVTPGPSPDQTLHAAALALEASVERLVRLPLKQRAQWGLVEQGLMRAYRKARRGFRLAYHSSDAEAFHAWRASVKRLFYQLEIVRPIWPKRLRRMGKRLDALGDKLGRDHDLTLVEQALAQQPEARHSPAAEVLRGVIARRRGKLRTDCRSLAARALRTKSKTFMRKLARRFDAWSNLPRPAQAVPRPAPSPAPTF